jgi:WS/DGAT/MGAT family acyltransferase
LLAQVGERLPRIPAMRRVLRDARFELDHPAWVEVASVDPDDHVFRRRLTSPGSLPQLWRLVAALHAEPLPRDRPLWQLVVIDGLASGELALYCKVHHALLDGQGGIALTSTLLDPGPNARAESAAVDADAQAPRRRRTAHARGWAGIVRELPHLLTRAADAAIGAGKLLARVRESLVVAPRTPFNVQVGTHRTFAVASLPFARVRRVARRFDASVNDVVLALCAGALRDYLKPRKALPAGPLTAAMPISLRPAGDTAVNNQVSMVQCALPTDVADPVERLRAITAATGRIKQKVSSLRSVIPTDFPGFAAPIWATLLSRLWASGHVAERLPPLANLVISNLPGPPRALYLAGARVLHSYPVSIVTHGLGLNVTVTSYAGALEFGLIGDRDCVPAIGTIARGIEHALGRLEKGT